MRVLLLCSAFNGLSQRAWLELRARGKEDQRGGMFSSSHCVAATLFYMPKRGLYRFRASASDSARRVQLLAAGAMLGEALKATAILEAEHGVGVLKREEMVQFKDATALALMRAVKQAIDPRGLMNSGRVL